MFCSFCKKGAPTLVTHHLCNCCLGNLLYSPKTPTAVVPQDGTAVRVQCAICFEQFPEDELQQHQDECMPRVVLRCNVCEQDYLTQEGLWNHLDLHEIADDKKDLYYEEKRSQHVIHKCELCNDQRGYQEISYWRHVHEDHDGFFLRCSECGTCFRSRKLRTEHILKYCQAREQAVPLDFEKLKVASGFSDTDLPVQNAENIPDELESAFLLVDPLEQTGLPLTNVAQEIHEENTISEESSTVQEATSDQNSGPITATTCLICMKDLNDLFSLARHKDNVHRKCTCSICDIVFIGSNQYRYHKLKYHSEPFYKCVYCHMQFHRLASFRRHMATHSTAYGYNCDLCPRKFKALEYFEIHRKRIHRKNGFSDAPSSVSQSPDGENLQQPTPHTTEDTPVIMCVICKLPFTNKTELKIHETNEHARLRYTCPHCPQMFRLRSALDNHLVEHVGVDAHGRKRIPKVVRKAFGTTRCAECNNKDYRTPRALTRHIDACHVPMTCPICGVVSYGRHRSQYHKMVCHTEPTYLCPHCPKKFHIRPALKSHLRQHKGVGGEDLSSFRYERSKFDQIYKQKGTSVTKEEEETIEKDEKITEPPKPQTMLRSSTSCRECYGEYYSKKALNNHMYLRHTPIACKLCGVISSGKQNANHHERTAHTDPTLKCPRCPRMFHAKSDLYRHLEVHISEERNATHQKADQGNPSSSISCTNCNREFSDGKALLCHTMEYHIPEMCDVCGFPSPSRRDARFHKLVKHGEPNLQCPQCPKKFYDNPALRRHLDKHSENKTSEQSFSDSDEMETDDVAIDQPESEKADELVLGYPDPDPDMHDPISEGQGTDSASADDFHKHSNHEETLLKKSDQDASETTSEDQILQILENSEEKQLCQYCDKSFNDSKSLFSHVKQTHMLCKCKICGATINGMNNLKYHELIYHSEPKFQCSFCPKSFHVSSTCRRHEESHSKQPTDLHEPPPDSESDASMQDSLADIKTEYPTSSQVEDESSCSGSISFEELLIKIETSTVQPNLQEFDAAETSNPKLRKKKQKHGNLAGKVQCPICKKMIKRGLLTSHIKCTHELCRCDKCGETLTGANQLKYHELVSHSEPKIECSYCSKKFYNKSFLNRHLKRHLKTPRVNAVPSPESDSEPKGPGTTIRNESIPVVREKISLPKPNLKEVGVAETSGGELVEPKKPKKKSACKKPAGHLPCPHCKKILGDERSYRLHIRYTHELLKCDVCGETIVGWNKLKYHQLKTHSEPKFECSYCLKKFHLKTAYTRHEEWHSKNVRAPTPDSESNLSVHDSIVGIKNEIEDDSL